MTRTPTTPDAQSKAAERLSPDRLKKSDVTRQRILDAAAKVFRDKGYAGARLTDIAAAAGMQAGSLYYHFASREELVEEVLRAGVQQAVDFVHEAVEALPADASATDRLRAAITSHLLTVLEIGDYTSANIRIFGQVPEEIRQRHLVDQREFGAYLARLLRAAQEAGEIRADVDLSVIRMLIFGALNWAVEWYQPGGRVSAEEVAAEFMAMVFEGLAVR
ncbi:MAG: TetR/AcrR family transcriptional regulator [Actinomycetota bacterium]|nr:TetR/AcrR family transcriptional regulator [Actinomycetota bacterium]